MIVDFGLICMFVIQLAFVMAVYHAWRGIKADISALEVLREGHRAVMSRMDAMEAQREALSGRVADIEAAPRAAKARIEDVEVAMAKAGRRMDGLEEKQLSFSGRLSAFARHRKVKEDDEETDPAPQGEGDIIPLGQMPPGSIPLSQPPPPAAVPPGFGVLSRRTRHG